MIKRVLAMTLALMLMVGCFAGIAAHADVNSVPEEFEAFIAYGGDKDSEGDWGYGYTGTDVDGITAVKETIKVGETKTISLTFEQASPNAWYFAPCLVADNVAAIGTLKFDITCKINGEEVAINMEADADGKTWWTEGTGDYSGDRCIRLAGSFNEWGTKYIEEPSNITSIEYTITLNEVSAAVQEPVALPEQFDLFVAYGGDKDSEGDWGYGYTGADVEGITAVKETICVGETKTVSLTFEQASPNAWYFAPCLVADGASAVTGLEFEITCKINGEEVAINMEADADGKVWWTEGTGDYSGDHCIRLAGGFNEWGTKYIEEPSNITSIEYTVTLTAVSGGKVEDDTPNDAPVFDPNATYNAYLLLQTPNWTYRNAWNDKTNGIDAETWGNALYGNETNEWYGKITDAVLAGNGTYTIEITDFGTIFEDDFAAAGQEYFNILGFTSDAPLGGLTITDVKLIIDGSTKHKVAEGYQNPDDTEYVNILIQNIWNNDVKEISYYPAPTTSLKIEFTVSGFSYDKEEAPTEEPTPTEPKPSEKPGTNEEEPDNTLTIVIAAVAAVVVIGVVVVVIVLKKKKNA